MADEVRNLAMRAAAAAKSTAGLIGTVKKIKDGSGLVVQTEMDFQVVGGVESTGELVGEISAASREQAQPGESFLSFGSASAASSFSKVAFRVILPMTCLTKVPFPPGQFRGSSSPS